MISAAGTETGGGKGAPSPDTPAVSRALPSPHGLVLRKLPGALPGVMASLGELRGFGWEPASRLGYLQDKQNQLAELHALHPMFAQPGTSFFAGGLRKHQFGAGRQDPSAHLSPLARGTAPGDRAEQGAKAETELDARRRMILKKDGDLIQV